VCDAYLTCVSVTTPEGLGVIAATYGPNGTCWQTMTADACADACLLALQHARLVYPNEASCPTCFSDADCQGSADGPACDAAQGRCVRCTRDAQCSGSQPACNTGTHTCVECTLPEHCAHGGCDVTRNVCTECLDDEDCLSLDASHCNVGAQECVECTDNSHCSAADRPVCLQSTHECGCSAGSQCTTGRCSTTAKTCCTPMPCPAGYCGWMPDSGCGGMKDCGACAHGQCSTDVVYPQGAGGHCWNIGAACTTADDCAAGERCLFSHSQQAHYCARDVEGEQCLASSGDADCTFLTQPVYAYKCLVTSGAFGVCTPWCLTAAECTAGDTCHEYYGSISPASPGICY
jgi:hypothetical protein